MSLASRPMRLSCPADILLQKVSTLEAARDTWEKKYEEMALKYKEVQQELEEFRREIEGM